MAKWGSCDFRQLQELQKKIDRLQVQDVNAFCEAAAKELAARLIAKTIKRTPVGVYPANSGKTGGTLRRGWTAATEAEAEGRGNSNARAYVDSLKVNKVGGVYEIEIVNPVSYASYVEYGHRTRGDGWVNGKFMMTISESEIDTQAPAILERKLMKYLGDAFNAK